MVVILILTLKYGTPCGWVFLLLLFHTILSFIKIVLIVILIVSWYYITQFKNNVLNYYFMDEYLGFMRSNLSLFSLRKNLLP